MRSIVRTIMDRLLRRRVKFIVVSLSSRDGTVTISRPLSRKEYQDLEARWHREIIERRGR